MLLLAAGAPAATLPVPVAELASTSVPAVPALRPARAALIGTHDGAAANRAYIGVTTERRNIAHAPAVHAAYTSLADASAERGDFGPAPLAYDGLVDDPPAAPEVSRAAGGAGVPASVSSAMLLAGLGLLVMVAHRRTLGR